MAITRGTMTDEQRKSVALEYLKAFDNAGKTLDGGSILDLFASDAQVFFPKWGLATGKQQIGQLFSDFGGRIKGILHDYASFNWIMTGTDTLLRCSDIQRSCFGVLRPIQRTSARDSAMTCMASRSSSSVSGRKGGQ